MLFFPKFCVAQTNQGDCVIDFSVAIVLCLKYDFVVPLILLLGILPCCVIKSRLKKYTYDVSKEMS